MQLRPVGSGLLDDFPEGRGSQLAIPILIVATGLHPAVQDTVMDEKRLLGSDIEDESARGDVSEHLRPTHHVSCIGRELLDKRSDARNLSRKDLHVAPEFLEDLLSNCHGNELEEHTTGNQRYVEDIPLREEFEPTVSMAQYG